MLNVEPAKYGPAHHPAVIDSRNPRHSGKNGDLRTT
jgi:hypothetical protein